MPYNGAMNALNPIIVLATIADYPTIQNMARFYVYDLSKHCGLTLKDWALPADGLYESFDYRIYFEDPTRKAFLIKVNDEIAGFVLLNQIGRLPETLWNMGEFFILGRFQGKHIGRYVAQQIWNQHPGLWEVSVIPDNLPAITFWRSVINDFTHGLYSETIMSVSHDDHPPNQVIFTFNTDLVTNS